MPRVNHRSNPNTLPSAHRLRAVWAVWATLLLLAGCSAPQPIPHAFAPELPRAQAYNPVALLPKKPQAPVALPALPELPAPTDGFTTSDAREVTDHRPPDQATAYVPQQRPAAPVEHPPVYWSRYPATPSFNGLQARPDTPQPPRFNAAEPEPELLAQGRASWYGQRFHGRRTASGEPFDMHALTAAHKTLPLGSRVRVRSVHTGKEVVVRINDRGPYKNQRIIDLSYAAAKALGVKERGVTEVLVPRE